MIVFQGKENMKRRHFSRNYRIISIMFWAFPYLLWQAFGNWSGFLVGVIVAVVLTAMFNSLFRTANWNTIPSQKQQSSQETEVQAQSREEAESYRRGYRGEDQPYRAESQADQVETFQTQYEEMQVPYPGEVMPPMEQK